MSEETEEPEAAGAGGGRAGADAAALALALGAASRVQADTFLKQQGRVAELLARKLEHEERFEHPHLRWRRFDDQMKGATRLVLVAIGALPVGAIALARLHLKWGKAFYYAGKPDLAQVEFARAAALDLSPSEKAELALQRPSI